jgi:DNA primase small subunit
LVFDIDINDYAHKSEDGEKVEIRTCCSGSEFCSQCWGLMDLAVRIVTRVLREVFGFHHAIWVFSGGRGVHCWVCDKSAIHLDDRSRVAIANYLSERRMYPEIEETFPTFQCLNTLDPLDLCPRIDMPVTTKANHLLKAPFCAHPRTGYICVPFDHEHPFSPYDAPTVSQVIASNGEVLQPWLELWAQFLQGVSASEPYEDPLIITDKDIPKQPFDPSKVF